MRGSIQIAKFFGIPVFVHWTFWLLLIYVPLIGLYKDMAPHQTIWLGGLMAATFVCVAMHEYGHALAARRYGIQTSDIILLPIGGVARLALMPEKPLQELIIAIAGPMVNVVIALLLSIWFIYPGISALPSVAPGDEMSLIGDYRFFVPALLFINVMLVVFNMLPAFPMDGGRVFRALLSSRFGLYKATQIATFFGQGIAALMLAYGLKEFSLTIIFIGVFIFFTAIRERKHIGYKTLLSRHKVADLLKENYTPLQMEDTMSKPFRLLAGNVERHFLVFDEQQKVVGALPDWAVLKAVNENGLMHRVGEYTQQGAKGVSKNDSLQMADDIMRQSGYPILPVFDNGVVAGVVDREALNDFIEVK